MRAPFLFLLEVFTCAVLMILPATSQEVGDFKHFKIEELSPPNSVKYMPDPTGDAPTKNVYSFQIPSGYCSNKKYGDGVSSDCTFNSTRSQMFEDTSSKKGGQGQPGAAWYGFSVYYPADFPFGTKQTKGHQDFAYWHNGHCAHLTLKNFAGTDDILALSTSIATGGYDCADGLSLKIADFKDIAGKWSRFEIFVKWSNGNSGEAQLFLNGKHIINYRGPTLTAGFEDKNYFKFGSYICCTGDVKKVVEHQILYAAVKRAATRDGLLVEEDHKAISSLQELLNKMGCDVGPTDGKLNQRTRDAALSCRAFPKGTQPASLTAGSIGAFLDFYRSPGMADLPRGAAPNATPEIALINYPELESGNNQSLVPAKYQVQGGEALAKRPGNGSEVDSDMTVKIQKNKDVPQIGFIVAGSYSYDLKNFTSLQFILQDKVQSNGSLSDCPASTTAFPDGTVHAQVNFSVNGNNLVSSNAKCLEQKLTKRQSNAVQFLVGNFSDIAVGMVKTGSSKLVRHEGLKSFLERVARGEIVVGYTSP